MNLYEFPTDEQLEGWYFVHPNKFLISREVKKIGKKILFGVTFVIVFLTLWIIQKWKEYVED